MKGLFSIDGPFVKYGGKAWDLFWLNILTILCSLPLVTLSTSFASMHYVLLKIFRDEETGITKAYFKAFGNNWRQGIPLQLIFTVVGYLLITAIWLLRQNGNPLMYAAIVALVLVLCVWLWAVILLSRYANSTVKTIKHGLAACLSYWGRTFLMLVVFLLPFFFLLFTYKMLIIILAVGFSAPGILQTLLYNDIFTILETPPEIVNSEE